MGGIRFLVVISLAVTFVAVANADDGKWKRYDSMVKAMQSNPLLEDAWENDHYDKFKEGQSQAIPESMQGIRERESEINR